MTHKMSDGYIMIKTYSTHPRAHKGFVYEHILIAEKALGKYLPKNAEVHHFNENKSDNSNTNLIICEGRAYHRLLHKRQRLFKQNKDPNKFKFCSLCDKIKELNNFYDDSSRSDGKSNKCKSCKFILNKIF